MVPPFEKLAIVAGRGALPRQVAERARSMGVEVLILALRDQANPDDFRPDFEVEPIRLGGAQHAIDLVKSNGISDLIFVGGVHRPSMLGLRPDAKAAKILGRGLLGLGDDGLLRAIIVYLREKEGLVVHPIHAIMDDIRPEPGCLSRHPVPDDAQMDIEKGRLVLNAMAHLDIGQAVVVQGGMVLGIEAAEGTDALIARCAALRREGPGPVLVKLSKPSQTESADLPTVGPETLRRAAESGFRGVVIEAGRSLLVDRNETLSAAESGGLFLLAIPGPDTGP